MQQTVGRLMGGQLQIERDRIDLQVLHEAGQRKFKESDADETIRKISLREVKVLRIVEHPNIVHLKERAA